MRSFAVSTLTFFRGDSAAAEVWIRGRTLELMRANPWLTGRLLSAAEDSPYKHKDKDQDKDKDKDATPVLRVCHQKEVTTPADIEQYLHVLHSPSLDPSVSYTDLLRGCHPELLVKRGVDSLDHSEECLFKVLFIHISADSFALVVSLSHMLGDGSTYYKVYSMLGEKEPVIAMTVARQLEYQQAAVKMVRLPDLVKSPFFLWRMLLFTVLNKFYPVCAFLAELDPTWVAEQKQQAVQHALQQQQRSSTASSEPAFVSTNDVLTSWFVNVLDLDFCIMALNARQRVPSAAVVGSGSFTILHNITVYILSYQY